MTTGLGVLGMPGFTAYGGLRVIGKPARGETVVVAAANWRAEFLLCLDLYADQRIASRVARFGPTTPKRATTSLAASVDQTDARKAAARSFGRSDDP